MNPIRALARARSMMTIIQLCSGWAMKVIPPSLFGGGGGPAVFGTVISEAMLKNCHRVVDTGQVAPGQWGKERKGKGAGLMN